MRTQNVISILKKGIFLVLLIAVNIGNAQDKGHAKELDAIFNAFKTKEYEGIQALLDPNVKIDPNIPVGFNDMVIPQVLQQLPVPVSYKVISKQQVDGGLQYTTEYAYADSEPRLQYFVFNAEGKVTELDVLRDAKKVEAQMGFMGQ